MQRIYIALALALTASCVMADWSADGFVKAPVTFVNDNETSFTNQTGGSLTFGLPTLSDIAVVNAVTNKTGVTNSSGYSWSLFWRKVTGKALTVDASNTNTTFTGPTPLIYNGYVISFNVEIDSINGTNGSNATVTAIRVYQSPITGGAALARLTLATISGYVLMPAGIVNVGKNIYVFYNTADKTVNFTSFTAGSTASANQYTVGSNIDAGSFQVVWGEALGSGQALGYWTESNTAKDAVIDLSKGTNTPAAVTGVTTNHTCMPYSTDKKLYGEFCMLVDNGTLKTFVKTNSSGIALLSSYNATTTGFQGVEPYGPYLAVFLNNGSRTSPVALSYEIWDLSSFTTNVAKKSFLSYGSPSVYQQARVPAGGIYGLLYNIGQNNVTYSKISVGLVLGSSYLTAILGFIMTIVAGLFLF